MPNSYEHSYQHNLDDVIDASDAVLAIGTEKVDTTTLKDRSLNNNDATIYGAMRASGYFDGGRIFDGVNDYLDCGSGSSLNIRDAIIMEVIVYPYNITETHQNIIQKTKYACELYSSRFRCDLVIDGTTRRTISSTSSIKANKINVVTAVYDKSCDRINLYINGIPVTTFHEQTIFTPHTIDDSSASSLNIGASHANTMYGKCISVSVSDIVYTSEQIKSRFNTLARLPLYSHNFERYPNSDTSLTSVFPYTSGIITSGSFNKTDGLKCTSAGQIIFSNSFEFDGREYITLIINGVEYSGTTTVTQGTITATIAQGSNDITIDMGTGDVLPDIRVQFREEV